MTTLIQVTKGSGTRRCDARCYNAAGGTCTCVCGGANHGKGLNHAIETTAQVAKQLMAESEQLVEMAEAVQLELDGLEIPADA